MLFNNSLEYSPKLPATWVLWLSHYFSQQAGYPPRRWLSGKEFACQCRQQRRCGFDPWVGKTPWRRAWQPTLGFLPGKSHGQRSLEGYSPWGHKESDTTEQGTLHLTQDCLQTSPINVKSMVHWDQLWGRISGKRWDVGHWVCDVWRGSPRDSQIAGDRSWLLSQDFDHRPQAIQSANLPALVRTGILNLSPIKTQWPTSHIFYLYKSQLYLCCPL